MNQSVSPQPAATGSAPTPAPLPHADPGSLHALVLQSLDDAGTMPTLMQRAGCVRYVVD